MRSHINSIADTVIASYMAQDDKITEIRIPSFHLNMNKNLPTGLSSSQPHCQERIFV